MQAQSGNQLEAGGRLMADARTGRDSALSQNESAELQDRDMKLIAINNPRLR